MRDDVVLVADTLVARAVRKLSRPLELRLRPVAGGRCVRIEVQVQPNWVVNLALLFPKGVGCDLIGQLSKRFGLEDRDDGSVLWAEVALLSRRAHPE